MTDDDPPPPEGFRPLTQDDFNTLPPPPEGFRPLTANEAQSFRSKFGPQPSMEDRIRTSLPGAFLQGATYLGQGAEQLAAHGAAAAADLLPVYPVKGSATGKPAPHGLAPALHGLAGEIDASIGRSNENYEAAGQRVDAASTNPTLSMALRRTAETGGAMVAPGAGALVPEVRAIGALGNAALKGTVSGAAYGASQPVLKPKDERDYWITKAKQTGAGGLTGAVLGAAQEKLSTVKDAVPTSTLLNSMKRDAYDAAEASNATVPKADFVRSLDNAIAEAHREVTYRANTHPTTATAIRTAYDELDQYPNEISFKDMDVVRKIMRSALESDKKSERSAAHIIIDGIDDHIRNLNAPEGSLLGEARSLASRAFKLEAVEAAMRKAENATGSGGFIPSGAHQSRNKFDNAVRQQFAAILNKPRAARQFDAAERGVMQTIVDGTTTQNLARMVGRVSPTRHAGSISFELASIASGAALGHSPEGIALAAGHAGAGMAAQHIADMASQRNVDALKTFIATRGRGVINVQRPPPRGFENGQQYIQNGHVYMMVNGVMVPQRRLEQ